MTYEGGITCLGRNRKCRGLNGHLTFAGKSIGCGLSRVAGTRYLGHYILTFLKKCGVTRHRTHCGHRSVCRGSGGLRGRGLNGLGFRGLNRLGLTRPGLGRRKGQGLRGGEGGLGLNEPLLKGLRLNHLRLKGGHLKLHGLRLGGLKLKLSGANNFLRSSSSLRTHNGYLHHYGK